MEKLFIKNRKDQKLAVLLEQPEHQAGLVFIMHGLGGTKEELRFENLAQPFRDAEFAVVRFDTTNSFGESDGEYADATTTNYYEDLEDVIVWASTQEFYQEPFYLLGHSLGGIAIALYAENHPEKVKGLAPIATVVSGKLSELRYDPEILKQWRETGWKIEQSKIIPGRIKKLKWAEMEDRLKYDLLPNASKLTMPVLLIVGSEDYMCPPEHQKLLYNAIPGTDKELQVIEGADHNFWNEAYLSEIKIILKNWITKTNDNN